MSPKNSYKDRASIFTADNAMTVMGYVMIIFGTWGSLYTIYAIAPIIWEYSHLILSLLVVIAVCTVLGNIHNIYRSDFVMDLMKMFCRCTGPRNNVRKNQALGELWQCRRCGTVHSHPLSTQIHHDDLS